MSFSDVCITNGGFCEINNQNMLQIDTLLLSKGAIKYHFI